MPDEHPLKRWFPRRKVFLPCSVSWKDRQVYGRTVDVSYAGVGVLLAEAVVVKGEALVQMPDGIWLRARRFTLSRKMEGGTTSDAGSSSSSGGRSDGRTCATCPVGNSESRTDTVTKRNPLRDSLLAHHLPD